MINDYIHMNSVFPSPSLPSVVFGAKTPTTTVGDTQDPPHSVLLPSEPIKGPDNTQLPFRQLLPSSPSEEERGLREGGRATRTAEEYVHLYSHTTSIYPTPPPHPPPPHTCTPPLSRSLTVRNTSTPFSCKKTCEEGGRGAGAVGGGAFMYIFVFGLVFSVSYLSEGRYNP